MEWQKYKESGFKNLSGEKANTLLKAESEEPTCWWATINTIEKNDYNLNAEQYKPLRTVKAPDDDPAELIQETLAIEKDIASGLKKLLQEIKDVE